jgi:Recombinase
MAARFRPVKGIKRAMAGEYSRELSVRVFAGQSRLARMGFKIGGPPGYGYRRLLIDQNGIAKGILAPGEQKSISADHVTLAPGPAEEVATVRWIFASFVQDRKTETEIAKALNQRGVVNSNGRAWNRNGIYQILKSEKYIGNYVWNQTSKKLHRRQVKNDPETWCRAEGAFEALIDRSLFDAAQRVYQVRKQRAVNGGYRKFSDEELLQYLRDLLAKHGYISRSLMRRNSVPCETTYHLRFGGLKNAFQKIGFVPQYGRRRSALTWTGRPQGLSDDEMLRRLRSLWQEHGYLTTKIIDRNKIVPATAQYRKRFGRLSRAYQLIGFVPDPKHIRLVRPLSKRGLPDEALLEHLRSVLKERGRLSSKILRETKVGPSRGTIEYRFGSLTRAFDLIGYKPDPYETRSPRPRGLTDDQMLFALWQLWRKRGHLSQPVIVRNKDVPSHHAYVKRFGSLTRAYDLIGFKVDRHPYRRKGIQTKDRQAPDDETAP